MSPDEPGRRRGTVLEGRYRMDGLLARGGMSTVHRGLDLRLHRPVALKLMTPELAEDPAFVRRFEREARAAARLAHPGIVAVHDQGRDLDGTVFLVLELVEGGTLRDVLRREGRLPPATALTVIEQVVTALRVAHRRGLVHRDVKPENVLVADDGAVKVADFGLVGAAHDGDDAGGPRTLLGTAAYLAPEQVAHGRSDERTDLYAAGVVLYELLTGVVPHRGADAVATARRHVDADVPAPSLGVPDVPPALDRLVVTMTRRDPAQRPSGAGAFLTAARAVRSATGLPFSPVAPPGRRPLPGGDADDAAVPVGSGRGGAGAGPVRPAPTGTRRLEIADLDDLDDLDPDRDGPDDDLDPDDPRVDDLAVPGTHRRGDPDRADDPEPGERPGRRGERGLDEVDDRLERLTRRRARTRSRRRFVASTVLVLAATAAAGSVGWALGLPG